jgi:hypothetical protein
MVWNGKGDRMEMVHHPGCMQCVSHQWNVLSAAPWDLSKAIYNADIAVSIHQNRSKVMLPVLSLLLCVPAVPEPQL